MLVAPQVVGLCGTDLELIDGLVDAAFVRYPANLVHRLPAGTPVEDVALAEPASVVYHGLARLLNRPGLQCLVVGDGTIALLAVQLLRLWSPARVVLAGRRREQGDLARAAGMDEVISKVPSQTFDLVIEAAGTNEAVVSALGAARRGAVVLLLGLPPHGSLASVPVDDLVNKDLLVRASFGYSSSTFSRVLALIAGRRLHPGILITHRFSFRDYDQALRILRATEPGEARGKVVLQVTAGAPTGDSSR